MAATSPMNGLMASRSDNVLAHDTSLDDMTIDNPQQENSDRTKLSPEDVAAVRKQVDYYFSDRNLQNDMFLLGKMKGRKNRPVAAKIIHEFARMKIFNPLDAVVDAMRTSETVNVVKENGTWCFRRKEPFIKEEKLGSVKRSKVQPTGLEEFFADAPVTPQEYSEEQDLYDSKKPFYERIEIAIQRYQARRKFSSLPREVFDKWMRYGGINTGHKQFSGGLDSERIESNNAADLAALTATSYVGDDKLDENVTWVVDFIAVTKGFLSSRVPSLFDLPDSTTIQATTNVLRNFYRYLLHHDVCPEHKLRIIEAIHIVNQAETELFATYRALLFFPGAFNTASSFLFGGYAHALYAGDQSWSGGSSDPGLTELDAKTAFALGMSAYEDFSVTIAREAAHTQVFHQTVKEIEENVGLEVVSVQPASVAVRELYASVSSKFDRPLGRLCCRAWTSNIFETWDLPEGMPTPDELRKGKQYEFYVEDDILHWCFPGMKIEATVRRLGSGMTFFDNVTRVHCSFYTVLENELMRKGTWQDVKWITREEQMARELRSANVGVFADAEEVDEADS